MNDMYQLEELIREALIVSAMLSLIPLGASVAVGVAVSIIQAVTQVQEQSLTYVVKLLTLAGLWYFLGGMGGTLVVELSQRLFERVAEISHGDLP